MKMKSYRHKWQCKLGLHRSFIVLRLSFPSIFVLQVFLLSMFDAFDACFSLNSKAPYTTFTHIITLTHTYIKTHRPCSAGAREGLRAVLFFFHLLNPLKVSGE